jgi:hypothetical protein
VMLPVLNNLPTSEPISDIPASPSSVRECHGLPRRANG